ncbi:hypothetical protein MRB56_08740 [Halomonas cupida]|uniref:hypothetical protein n=1 Tax=Halomonas cupida TaxID=44933 RepID=UPI0039B4E5B6
MDQQIDRDDTVKISSDGVYRGASVHIPYPLENSDFLKITKVNSLLPIWAHAFFTGTSVFVITVASKWINHKYFSGIENVSTTEVITLSILAALAVTFEGLYLLLPSEKKKTITKIKKHFKDNEPKAAGFNHE